MDHILGEDIACSNFERHYSINALTFVSTLTLSSHDLHSILSFKSFDYHRRRARKLGILIALRARLKNLSKMVRIVRTMASFAGARAEIRPRDFFNEESKNLISSREEIEDRFHIASRPRSDGSGGMEKVLCLKPKFQVVDEVVAVEATDLTVEQLIAEVKAMDVNEMTPDAAVEKLRFYQRARTHLLFAKQRQQARLKESSMLAQAKALVTSTSVIVH